MTNLYLELHDCASREAYLQMLAEDEGVDIDIVNALADLLGPTEDFDGLVTALQDIAGES